jgi:hypothetical protein
MGRGRKTGGRKPGVPNRATAATRDVFQALLDANQDKLQAALDEAHKSEARAAEVSTCRWHKGRISTDPLPSDVDGKVFFCPLGRQFWRYTKKDDAFHQPLPGSRMA